MGQERTFRCGWRVVHSSPALNPDAAPLVLVSNAEMRFYLPQDLYEDLDDGAFLALCETERNVQKRGPQK